MNRAIHLASVGLATATLVTGLVTATATTATAAPRPNASSTQCGFTNAQPVLRRGSTGTAVIQLQCELNFAWVYQFHNGGLVEDGQFGPATQAQVRSFQSCVGLTVDGVVGPQTWAALDTWTTHDGFPYWAC